MSQIHTLDPNKGDEMQLPNPWNSEGQTIHSTGRPNQGRSLSGRTSPAPWDLEEGRAHNTSRNTSFMQFPQSSTQTPRMVDGFWSDNLPSDRSQNTAEIIATMCGCACCIGPCCSATRQKDWKRFFSSFTIIMMILQLIYLIIEYSFSWATTKNFSFGISTNVLIKLGALYRPLVKYKFQIWRLILPVLMHSDISHYAFNMFFQYRIMLYKEVDWGKIKTMVIYFLSAFCGCLLSASIPNDSKVSVGASGALLGVYGALIVDILCKWKEMDQMTKVNNIVNFALFMMIMFIFGTGPHIDNYAHLGGLLGGACIGGILIPKSKTIHLISSISLAVSIILPACLLIFVR
ncbi:putative Rhomboid-like serine peptidase [Monocercomonoides exilis]|uniref:putative Rhomboid-like serine peptidase n=1 Tax=Monocercomonoides exilis TaxID=2049356 RepID=UPI0035594500|nr:putative Rhomboid-like serine peptidase [Monocercomonoides exilis]|eukprot:MONOS_11071.1-p1 / transcript=MONOS_11071.1 / gene=MONOS_11071 / organism=Monocercomonoides_exilis_PA203 / gene_product=Clan S-, family S54, Rhomboid-like serine peptidase / transcript_product=Clan S-, family S54, Rhomboid-like serine peptidase / location=Mono_scaffold00534:36858-38555(+) / protein_length=346 / sequence_SO=supercontig / SO=protein_coding / is_pseudo=false